MDPSKAATLLRSSYEANGYIRVKMERRRDGQRTGWEVRLFVDTSERVDRLIAALRGLGLKPGAPFRKRAGWIVPVYGAEQVERFLHRVRPRVKGTMPEFPDAVDLRHAPGSSGLRHSR